MISLTAIRHYLVLCVAVTGVSAFSTPRVLRFSVGSEGTPSWFNVNGARPSSVQIADITNTVAKLQPHEGDVVLLDLRGALTSPAASNCLAWLGTYCTSCKAVVYIAGSGTSINASNPPVYHWVPRDLDPRDLPGATFYREGKRLGRGLRGFQSLLKSIESSAPKSVFILGGFYGTDNSYSAFEVPYRDYQDRLAETLSRAGSKNLNPSKLP